MLSLQMQNRLCQNATQTSMEVNKSYYMNTNREFWRTFHVAR